MCYACLTPMLAETYRSLCKLTAAPETSGGVTSLQLAPCVGFPFVARLDALLHDLEARGVTRLAGAERDALLDIAAHISMRPGDGAMHRLAGGLVDAGRSGAPIRLESVRRLDVEVRHTVANTVQQRICQIRKVFRECRRPGASRETITEQPYRIVREAPAGDFDVAIHLAPLFWSMNRPAMYEEIGFLECASLHTVHLRYRKAVRTGQVTDDEGAHAGICTRLAEIPDPRVRATLQRTLDHSELFTTLADVFYRRLDGHLVMRDAARPHAPQVILALTAIRNAIVEALNGLFVPCGFEAIPLTEKCGAFPSRDEWVPGGKLPGVPRMSDEALVAEFERLYPIGLDLWYDDHGGTQGPRPPHRTAA